MPVRVSSFGQISLADIVFESGGVGLEGAFDLYWEKADGTSGTLEFDNSGTGMQGGGILGGLSSLQRTVRLIEQLNLQLIDLTTGGFVATPDLSHIDLSDPGFGIRLTARDPDIVYLKVTPQSGNDFGFLDGQFEDQRAVGLGFTSGQSGTGSILADADAPLNGKINQDVLFTLTVDGTEVEVMLHASTLKERVDSPDGLTTLTGLDALAAQLNDVLEMALMEAGLDGDAVVAAVNGDQLQFNASETQQLKVEWDRMEISYLSIDFSIDLEEGDTEGRLTIPELYGSLFDHLGLSVLAEAEANLHVNTNANTITDFVEDILGFDGLGLPEIDFDFTAGYSASIPTFCGIPYPKTKIHNFRFANIQIDVGELLSTLLSPILEGVQQVLGPVFDILGPAAHSTQGFLNAPVPVLSDISSFLGISDDFSLLDFTGNKQTFNMFFDSVVAMIDLIDAFNDIDFDNGPIIVNLGCWELDMYKKSPTYFPTFGFPIPCEVVDIFSELDAGGFPEIPDLLELLGVTADGHASFENSPGGFKLDLLNPDNIFKLILGETFDIFSYQMAGLHMDLELDLGFDFDVLNFGVGGGLNLDTQFTLVYDSTGLDRIQKTRDQGLDPDYSDLLDGFYLRTIKGPEFKLGANFYGKGGIDITTPAFCIGPLCTPEFTIFAVQAEVYGDFAIGLDLRDPNEDGALRLDEIMDLTHDFRDPQNLFFLFDIVGSAHFVFDISGTLLGCTLSTSHLPVNFTHIGGSFSAQDFFCDTFGIDSPFDPILGEVVDSTGVLRINAGEFGYARIHEDTDDSDGVSGWTVSSSGNDIIISDGKGNDTTIDSAGVDSIVFRGSNENDSIDFSGLALDIPVDARGGIGNDTIKGGAGNDLILGETGHDLLYGGPGDDALYGGQGEDHLYGNDGRDLLTGGRDNDVLEGGADADTYVYGATRDELYGWGEDSVIENVQITGVVDNGSGLVRVTAPGHGLKDDDIITLSGVGGVDGAEGVFQVTRVDDSKFDLKGSSFSGTYETETGAFFKEAHILDITGVQDEYAYVLGTGTIAKPVGGSQDVENLGTESGLIRVTAFLHGLSTGDSVTVSGVVGLNGEANGTFNVIKVSDNRFDLEGSQVPGPGRIRITSADHGLLTGDIVSITGIGGVSNANGTQTITKIDDDTIQLDGSKFIGAYERLNGAGFIIVDSKRTFSQIEDDEASTLKVLTDTLDFTALGSSKPLLINLDTSGTLVTIGTERSGCEYCYREQQPGRDYSRQQG